jgi:hypothetical protein
MHGEKGASTAFGPFTVGLPEDSQTLIKAAEKFDLE